MQTCDRITIQYFKIDEITILLALDRINKHIIILIVHITNVSLNSVENYQYNITSPVFITYNITMLPINNRYLMLFDFLRLPLHLTNLSNFGAA